MGTLLPGRTLLSWILRQYCILLLTLLLGRSQLLNPLLTNLHDLGTSLEGALDHLLGEAKAEVRDAPGQMKSGSAAKKAFEEEPPKPLLEDAAGPSKEFLAQEEDDQVEEKTPNVG
ncbi:UNVERIFIED_CONTAM: hypothetical protein Sradi_3772900 [Sesamum radiatum]|uniref:Uncharacterized protein n=1 Tax=Sesamum radiatum TaxID=300843 RepID=A0AAW2PZ95_SESRA